jgi:hypothetical protein
MVRSLSYGNFGANFELLSWCLSVFLEFTKEVKLIVCKQQTMTTTYKSCGDKALYIVGFGSR